MRKEGSTIFCRLKSFYLNGTTPEYLVIEVSSSSRGIPGVHVSGVRGGQTGNTIRKIRAAFSNSEIGFPNKKITINVLPSNVLRDLSEIEFPISMGIIFTHILPIHEVGHIFYGGVDSMGCLISMPKTIFMGELIGRKFANCGSVEKFFVPSGSYYFFEKNAPVEIYKINSLKDALNFFKGGEFEHSGKISLPEVCSEKFMSRSGNGFEGVVGNEHAKRALTISLAGKHNLLMLGPSGAGKSILAKRCASLFPVPDERCIIDRLKAGALTGRSFEGGCTETPFVAPHITTTEKEMVGSSMAPGYVTAAHGGLLFLDETHLFSTRILNSLKTVIDERGVTFSSERGAQRYPADFLLIAAANNCMCGLSGSDDKQCKCGGREINSYNSRMTPSFLERFDIVTYVSGSSVEAVMGDVSGGDSDTGEIVSRAVEIQKRRFSSCDINSNSHIQYKFINDFCPLDREAASLLEIAVSRYALSTRSVHRILSVSRTIADLDGEEKISSDHVAEAVQYRVKNDKP